jgi:hypothetical protein
MPHPHLIEKYLSRIFKVIDFCGTFLQKAALKTNRLLAQQRYLL